MSLPPSATASLPKDADRAVLVGRAWLPDKGPAVIAVADGTARDITASAPTIAHLLNADDPAALVSGAEGPLLGSLESLLAQVGDRDTPHLLAPVDVQAIKAAGVTFAVSTLERVLEEHAKGDPQKAASLRDKLDAEIGRELRRIRPGSDDAAKLKATLSEQGLWSPYLEVGLGPDAEIFTKAQPMSALGTGAEIGIHPRSHWNNPEPEVVLAAGADGRIKGAMLGNDVNLRDFEGRSSLLLGRAKDANGSCALGPFLRLFADGFGLDEVRRMDVGLTILGDDGFRLAGSSSMSEISRDPADLMAQTFDAHQYPDGVVLFTGTMFAPIQDRDEPNMGFTHKLGDVVTIAAEPLGALINRVGRADAIAPWRYGIAELMRSLAARGAL